MHPKVSVIVPCYNQARYLPRAIASLQAQTLEDWECIIVDDGSTDNTSEVAANMALRDTRIRLIQKINGGSASARDAGIQAAQGGFIQFYDADDMLFPEKLERQTAIMEQENLDISYTAFCFEYSNGERTKAKSVPLSLRRILVHWGMEASVPIHAFLYRTEFILGNELTFKGECRYREDWRWHILCFCSQPKTSCMTEYCGAIYYQNENGKTGSYIRMQEGNFTFMAYMAKQLKGLYKFLWAFRVSEELWIWLLRMIKYRSGEIAKSIFLLDIPWIVAAILLMPVSIWWVVAYFIKTYIAK